MSNIFTASEVVGKTLFAAQDNINIHRLPDPASEIDRTVGKGQRVGSVFSYVIRQEKIWWMLESNLYVEHKKGRFDLSSLKDQGALDVVAERLKKERDLMSQGQKLLSDFGASFSDIFSGTGNVLKIALPVIIIAAALIFLYRFYTISQKL